MTNAQAKHISDDRLDRLSWIADKWIYRDTASVTYENWIRESDGSFTGEAFTVKRDNSIFSEELRIEKIGEDIFYIAVVEHNPAAVKFKLVEISSNSAVFENPEHDFPNRIMYRLKSSDSLYARIEGKDKEGNSITGEFFYSRAR